MIYKDLEILNNIVDFYKKLPGIGEKSAERMALSSIEQDEKEILKYAKSLKDSKTELKKCEICGHLTSKKICSICSDENRNKSLICVLEDYKSVFAFEKAGNYKGTYHVLGGLISPIDNIKPEDINLASLIKRCRENEGVEIIIALKSNMEGETTTLYIKKILENDKVNISRLSYGIPMGAEIDYMDPTTLDRALEDRKYMQQKE
jgi:recombination protein RecR